MGFQYIQQSHKWTPLKPKEKIPQRLALMEHTRWCAQPQPCGAAICKWFFQEPKALPFWMVILLYSSANHGLLNDLNDMLMQKFHFSISAPPSQAVLRSLVACSWSLWSVGPQTSASESVGSQHQSPRVAYSGIWDENGPSGKHQARVKGIASSSKILSWSPFWMRPTASNCSLSSAQQHGSSTTVLAILGAMCGGRIYNGHQSEGTKVLKKEESSQLWPTSWRVPAELVFSCFFCVLFWRRFAKYG